MIAEVNTVSSGGEGQIDAVIDENLRGRLQRSDLLQVIPEVEVIAALVAHLDPANACCIETLDLLWKCDAIGVAGQRINSRYVLTCESHWRINAETLP
jgi:hypothetical protein